MSFILKNVTAAPVEIDDLGLTIDATSTLDLTPEPANAIAISSDLLAFINSGAVRVVSPLDGITELSQADSLIVIQLANDPHYGIHAGKTTQLDDFSSATANQGDVPQWDSVNGEYVPSSVTSGNIPTQFFAHNNQTTQTFSAGLVAILFPTQVRNDTAYTYNSGSVTINTTGWYQITYQISSGNTVNSRTTSEAGLTLNSTSTFIPGSLSYGYHRNSSQGAVTVSGSMLIFLNTSDVIRVLTHRVSGSGILETLTDGCRMQISSIGAP